MLRARILTAGVLLGVLWPAIFAAPAWVWGAVSLLAVTIGAREWERLLGYSIRPWGLATGVALLGGAWLLVRTSAAGDWLMEAPRLLAWAATGFWLSVAPWSLRRLKRVGAGRIVAGVLLLSAWTALLELRMQGPWTLVSCMALVWCADIGAYAAGRRFGRHKLAPHVSPGKTWEGAWGGWVTAWLGVVIMGAWGVGLAGALAPRLTGWQGGVMVAAVVTLLVALSIVGDLYESLLKRLAGVKDSGTVLPGHGGVLDRIDALLPSMPVCWLLLDALAQ